MDEVPAVPFRQEPQARELQGDGAALADEPYFDGRDASVDGSVDGARRIGPVPSQGDLSREPHLRSDFGAADDEWVSPRAAPAGAYDVAGDEGRPFVARSKTVTIDLQRLREGGMIAPDGDKTPLAEEFRVIKRPLLKNAFGAGSQIRNGNLIMVTSAFPREGKSFCAINLAMSIAMERDRTVLLVDADVARPSIPQKFGIAPDVGLMDVLLDSHVSLSDAIVRTNVNKLALLPAGRPHRQATELLASEAMANLLAEVSERYSDRIVIFDSPPLLVTTEARTLAANMGQIVMVVESDSTTHEALREALSTIESCEVVGMVLNKGRRSNPGDSYGYYGY
jgi:exopolysaccharide/PEP-CTERM locus tyrosine autokinase